MSEDRNSMLQLLILSTLVDNLDKGSLTATEIIDIIATDLADVWIPKRGTIYPAIKQLIHKGYLERTDDRPMRVWISSIGMEKVPDLSDSLLQNLKTYFDFIYVYQENLADNFSEHRTVFLSDLISFLSSREEEFTQAHDESMTDHSGWKDVKIR